MAKNIHIISEDKVKKTIDIELDLEGGKKVISIKDSGDEAENFRAMCRELHNMEKDLKKLKGV